MVNPLPTRGDIWVMQFDPVRGHEQGGKRPGLIISVDTFNHGPSQLIMALPLTTKQKRIASHVEISPPEGGVPRQSYIKCEDIRSLSYERLGKRMGRISSSSLVAVESRMRILMGL